MRTRGRLCQCPAHPMQLLPRQGPVLCASCRLFVVCAGAPGQGPGIRAVRGVSFVPVPCTPNAVAAACINWHARQSLLSRTAAGTVLPPPPPAVPCTMVPGIIPCFFLPSPLLPSIPPVPPLAQDPGVHAHNSSQDTCVQRDESIRFWRWTTPAARKNMHLPSL